MLVFCVVVKKATVPFENTQIKGTKLFQEAHPHPFYM